MSIGGPHEVLPSHDGGRQLDGAPPPLPGRPPSRVPVGRVTFCRPTRRRCASAPVPRGRVRADRRPDQGGPGRRRGERRTPGRSGRLGRRDRHRRRYGYARSRADRRERSRDGQGADGPSMEAGHDRRPPELLGLLSWQDVGSFGPLSYPYGPFSYCGPGVTESDPSDGPVGRRLAGFVPARDEASLSAKSDWRRR